eukprot:SAG22_NODE_7986_length_693_cov_1.020202_2_plen_97_part_00
MSFWSIIRCLIDTKVTIYDEHVEEFRDLWREGKTDPLGLYRGAPFTSAPEHKVIEIGRIAEFVPQLLPPTELLDKSWKTKSTAEFLTDLLLSEKEM